MGAGCMASTFTLRKSFGPDELQKTGDYDRRETFYDGETARVSQSGELLD